MTWVQLISNFFLATLERLLILSALNFLKEFVNTTQIRVTKTQFPVEQLPNCKDPYKTKVLTIMSVLKTCCRSNCRLYAFLILKHAYAFGL